MLSRTAFLATLLLAPFASLAANAQSAKSLDVVHYPLPSGTNELPVKFGIEKGFFREEGIQIDYVNASDPIPPLISGDLDLAFGAPPNSILAAGKGAPIRIVSSAFRTTPFFFLVAAKGIDRVEQLKGKTVGAGALRNDSELTLQYILRGNNLTPKDISVAGNGFSESAYGSLESGAVSATILHIYYAYLAEKNGLGKIIGWGPDFVPKNYYGGVITANAGFIEKRPDVLRRFLKAYFKSYTYARDNFDNDYFPFLTREAKFDPQVLRKGLEQEIKLWRLSPEIRVEDFVASQEIALQAGILDKVYDPNKILDMRFVPVEYIKR